MAKHKPVKVPAYEDQMSTRQTSVST